MHARPDTSPGDPESFRQEIPGLVYRPLLNVIGSHPVQDRKIAMLSIQIALMDAYEDGIDFLDKVNFK